MVRILGNEISGKQSKSIVDPDKENFKRIECHILRPPIELEL